MTNEHGVLLAATRALCGDNSFLEMYLKIYQQELWKSFSGRRVVREFLNQARKQGSWAKHKYSRLESQLKEEEFFFESELISFIKWLSKKRQQSPRKDRILFCIASIFFWSIAFALAEEINLLSGLVTVFIIVMMFPPTMLLYIETKKPNKTLLDIFDEALS
jgi:Flp pilus assembly protein TadB